MKLFHWSDELHTGIKTLDDQHQELTRLINAFLKHCVDKGCQRRDLVKTFTALHSYVIEHFSLEEHLAVEYQYPDAKALLRDHRHLRSWVEDTEATLPKRELTSDFTMDVAYFLVELLQRHIRVMDRRLTDFLHRHAATGFDQKLHNLIRGVWGKTT